MKLLIVDDKPENIYAAKEFFYSLKDRKAMELERNMINSLDKELMITSLEIKTNFQNTEKLLNSVRENYKQKVEDIRNNILALRGFDITYCNSEKQAIDTIIANEKDKFDFIISDLEMETEKSGLNVIRKGYEYCTYGIIATERGKEGIGHGLQTNLIPLQTSIQGKKNQTSTWEQIYIASMDFMEEDKYVIQALNNVHKYFEKVNDNETLDSIMERYQI